MEPEKIARRRELLGNSWYEKIGDELDKEYMQNISSYVAQRRQIVPVYPDRDNLFRAYQLTPYEEVKVVCIGQDPYSDGAATGVAFGVSEVWATEQKVYAYPKSLDMIDKAIEEDIYGGLHFPPIDSDLEYLCKQGVLLINSVLTVEHKAPNSHTKLGWQWFNVRAIQELNKKDFVVYLLWGTEAQKYEKYITDKHAVIKAEHPIAHKYAGRDSWQYERCFSKCNQLLINNNLETINW